MQKAIELVVDGRVLRGMEHLPDAVANSEDTQAVPAVIVFHGFTGDKMGSHRMYVKLSRLLESMGYACFRFDFSGSGESDGNFEDMTLSLELHEAEAILDFVRNHPKVDPGRVNLFGHSMGGVVASVLGASRPEAVHRLILLCAAGNMATTIAETIREMTESSRGEPLPPVYDNEGDLVGMPFAQEISQMDLFELAKGFERPVLLIHGTQDEAVPVETSQRYKDLCYGDSATIRLVEGADHSFNGHLWEQAVLSSTAEFLTRSN